jgi:hypothetical protein
LQREGGRPQPADWGAGQQPPRHFAAAEGAVFGYIRRAGNRYLKRRLRRPGGASAKRWDPTNREVLDEGKNERQGGMQVLHASPASLERLDNRVRVPKLDLSIGWPRRPWCLGASLLGRAAPMGQAAIRLARHFAAEERMVFGCIRGTGNR